MSDKNEMIGAIEGTVERASSGAHQAIDKVSGAALPAVEHLAAGAHQTVDSLAGAATQAAKTVDGKTRQLKEVPSRLATSCCAQIRDKPVTALGIAVATGLVLGWLLKRRCTAGSNS